MSHRRRLGAVLALLVATGAVLAVLDIAGSAPSAPSEKDGSGAAETTVVQRRNLVAIDTESGTLSYADSQTVYDRLNGTITWLPRVGQAIGLGGKLFAVDGQPVILLDGSTPAFRALLPSDSEGPDILQLNRNLVALGFNPAGIVLDDQWQPATTAGLKELQASLGESQTGELAFGQVVFLQGNQLVASVQATLGSGGGGSSGSPSPSGTSTSAPPPAARPQDAGFTSIDSAGPSLPERNRSQRTGGARHTQRLEALIAHLQEEIAKLRTASAGSPTSTPEGNASPIPILQTTSTRLVVTVEMEASKQSEARLGERVGVELPDGAIVNGRVAAISRVAQPTTGNSSESQSGENGNGGGGSGNSGSSIPVTIALRGHNAGAGLAHASVSVNFTQAIAKHVLCVPVSALLATVGGNYAVQAAAPPQKLIPVGTGLFAGGYVQISGAGVYPGLRVTNSQG